ncbi:putative amsh [Tripterygium wilfordii]|uniref:Putative amsh n=1 Tax=Tripterygium wilfordii TaxID=458696 RepID=A0A7J7C890_TRIWF|nr:putative amsh [Tripterygium wilfordii]
MRSSSDKINIAASAQKLDVDHRISLRIYYRIADNILRQADIFRSEKNIIDLYVMLLRFSSLVSETIPRHRDYGSSLPSKKVYLKKKLLNALSELEDLKPVVQQKINELDRKHTQQANGLGYRHQNDSLEWPYVKKQSYNVTKSVGPAARDLAYQGPRTQQILLSRPVDDQLRRLSLNFVRPTAETLSRHSIFGPNGLSGQWQPPKSDAVVRYPSSIDLSPIKIPSLAHPLENGLKLKNDNSNSETDSLQQSLDCGISVEQDCTKTEPERPCLESSLNLNNDGQVQHVEEPAMITFETVETPVHTNLIRQPSPPPILAEVQDLIPAMTSQVTEAEYKMENPVADEILRAEAPLQLHISTVLMENFMKLAKSNTDKNLETCGILAGSLVSSEN